MPVKQRLDRSSDGIYYFSFRRAHGVRDLHLVVGFGLHRHDSRANTTTGGWSLSAPIRATS